MLNKVKWLVILVMGSLLWDSEADAASSSAKLKVLSTLNILESTVSSIACCDIESSSLMGAGVDPHLYRATARDLSKIRQSDLIFAVGLHLEGRLQETLRQSASKGAPVKFLGERLPKARLFEGDPHVWFDPELWMQVGDEIAKELIHVRPQHQKQIQSNLNAWKKNVFNLAERAKEQFAKIPKPRRILVTSHDAFQYFGRYFDIEVHAVQGTSTDSEAGLKHMDELRQLIIKRKVPAIFVESSVSRMGIERLIEATGARLGGELYSDALGPKGSAASTYEGMLNHNLKTVLEALK